jgi:two-component system LytT family response regulator
MNNTTLLPDETGSGNHESLFVKSERRILRICFNDINYIEGMREYVRIHTDGKPVMTLLSMKGLEEKLPPHQFMRIHRSYIINLSKINVIEHHHILFDKNVSIPVGKQYKEVFKAWIDKNFL